MSDPYVRVVTETRNDKKIISSYHDPLAARSGRKGPLEYSLQEWDLLQPAGVPQPQGWDFMEAFASQPAALLTFTKELLEEKQAGELPTEGLEFVRDTELAGIKKWDFQQKTQGLPVLDAAGEQVFLPAPRLGSASGRRECLRASQRDPVENSRFLSVGGQLGTDEPEDLAMGAGVLGHAGSAADIGRGIVAGAQRRRQGSSDAPCFHTR